MKRTKSFLIFVIFLFLNISNSISNDYLIKKVEITGNKRIPTSFITNITNKYINQKIRLVYRDHIFLYSTFKGGRYS